MTTRAKRLLCWYVTLTLISVLINTFAQSPSSLRSSIYDTFCRDSCIYCVEKYDLLGVRDFWCCVHDWTCWFYLDLYRDWLCERKIYLCIEETIAEISAYAEEEELVYICYGEPDKCKKRGKCCDFGI